MQTKTIGAASILVMALALVAGTANAVEYTLPKNLTRIDCVDGHRELGHCQAGNSTVAEGVRVEYEIEARLSNGTPAIGPVTLWTGADLTLSFTFTQSDLDNVTPYDYTLEMQPTLGANMTGPTNASFQIRGNGSHSVSFPIETYDEWYEGDRVFVRTVLTHASGTESLWTQLVYDDPATGAADATTPTPTPDVTPGTPTSPTEVVEERDETPLGALALVAVVAAALLVVRRRA